MREPETNDGRVVCHECDAEYDRIGYHWANGQCDYPDIPDTKASLITGLMLGDGTLRTHTNEPFVQVYSINKPFLDWIDRQLDWLTTGVSLYRSAERSAELSRSNGHDVDVADYHDVYVVQTRTMPQFRKYESWYDEDGKGIPSYLVLMPMTARVWYACDGALNWDRRYPNARPYATISVSGQVEESETVVRLFRESSFDGEPVFDGGVRFSVDDTEAFLDWIGDPPDGVGYKWNTESIDDYQGSKDRALGDD